MFGVAQELERHCPGREGVVLKETTDSPLVFQGNYRIAASGRRITFVYSKYIGCSSALRDRFYLAAGKGAGTWPKLFWIIAPGQKPFPTRGFY